MALHVFRYRDTDIYALTYDRTGANLPVPKHGEWRYFETLDPIHFAWGEENFGAAQAALDVDGFFLFEGEMVSAQEDIPARVPKVWV
jgi:hypothetical protein